MHLKKQQGMTLLFALIIVAAVSILSGSIFYMIKVSIMESEAINQKNDAGNASFLAFRRNLALQTYHYSNVPLVPPEKSYTTGKHNITITNTVNTPIAPDSLVLNNASAILQYKASIITSNSGDNGQIVYEALINTPSHYRPQQGMTPQVEQPVNIPVVVLENLSSAQKNADNSLNRAEAGYIGDIAVDNANHRLIYTPYSETNPTSFLLSFPNNEVYNLTQGWSLSSGKWILNLFIYSATNYAYQANINLSTLLNLGSNVPNNDDNDDNDDDNNGSDSGNNDSNNPRNAFSGLAWVPILIPNSSESEYSASHKYPKGSYVSFNDQKFVSVAPINSGNNKDPYNNPSQWRLIIPPKTYPDWNTSIKYLRGDMITQNSARYVAVKSANQNQRPPPSNRWALVTSTDPALWQLNKAYNPGDMVSYSGFTFINIKKSNANKTPLQQPQNWRVVATDDTPLAYNANIAYEPGQRITYDDQIFVNIRSTSNNPYQNNQNRWRIILPQSPIADYNANVRYYRDDKVTFSGNTYQANVNYDKSVAPGQSPEKKPGKWA